MLRKFQKSYIDKDLSYLDQDLEDCLIFNCTLDKLSGRTLKNCDLGNSKVITKKVRDLLGLTVTLDCFTFKGVELSPLAFDLLLLMVYQTKGNATRRRKLLNLIGKDRVRELLQQVKDLERL